MTVSTQRLLRRIHAGFRTRDAGMAIAAESCLSFLVIHLRLDFLVLPPELLPHYNILPDA